MSAPPRQAEAPLLICLLKYRVRQPGTLLAVVAGGRVGLQGDREWYGARLAGRRGATRG